MAITTISIKSNPSPTATALIYEYTGLSTDTKPTTGVGDNSTFEELDTKKIWRYSATNTNPVTSTGWWEY